MCLHHHFMPWIYWVPSPKSLSNMSSSLALSLSLHPTAIQNSSHHTKIHQPLNNINHNNNNNNNHLPPILTNTTRSLENHAFSLLQSSSSFLHLTQIHAHISRHSLHHSNFLITKLVSSCLSAHNPSYALQVFEQMPHPNIFLWNALIRGLVNLHAHHDALLFYFRMLDSGFLPNNFTFPFLLKECSKLLALKQGKTVHAQILKLGFSLDVYTQTALLDFYGSCGEILAVRYLFDRMPDRDVVCWNAVVASHVRCGLVDDAEEVFDAMPVRNVSSWTTMIGGFIQTGKSVEALALFHRMQMDGVKPDKMAVVTILSAIADLGVLDLGRWVHDYVEKNGIQIDAFVGTALIDMYWKCGSVRTARAVFDAIGAKTMGRMGV